MLLPLIRGALYGLLLGLVVGYGKGCSDGERERDAFAAQVATAAHEQDKRTAREIGRREAITALLEEDHEIEATRVRRERDAALVRLRDANARARVVPAVPAAPGRPDGEICYDAAQLDRALRASLGRFLERSARIVGDGDEALGLQALCSRWLNEQIAVPR